MAQTPPLRKLAWYYFADDGWTYVGNEVDRTARVVSASVRGFGGFAVVPDTVAPELNLIRPNEGDPNLRPGSAIVIRFADSLSGIQDEDHFRLEIDGRKAIAEWDPEEEILRYVPDPPLAPGRHRLRVWVEDRCGNRSERSLEFFVK